MQIRKTLLAVAVTAALAACGGGTMEAATPAGAASALRAQAQALRNAAVTPEEAARQLMDAAESAYGAYFPSHQQTQSAGPFHFRYYPETQVYLGVVVTAGMGYEVGAIYVIGGPFGGSIESPVAQGFVTNYITPVAPAPTTPPPAGASNGCFDLDLLHTPGTTFAVSYRYSGTNDTQALESTVGGVVTFEGVQARETTTRTIGNVQGQAFDFTSKAYTARTGDAEVTEYGMLSLASAMMPEMRTVYSPPYVERMYALAVGEAYTATRTGTYTYSVNGTPSSYTSNDTSTTTYLGRETVTVAAGNYEACKFETTSGPTTAPSTNWYLVGKGIHLKSVSGSSTTEATSVRFNGQAL